MYVNQGLTALLVLEALILFVAVPVAAAGTATLLYGGSVLAILLTLALVAISPGITSKVLACLSIALSFTGVALRISHPSSITIWLGHGAVILGLIAASIVISRVVFRRGRITHHRIQGAIVLYLNIALIFTSAFRLIAELVPTAFANYPVGQPEPVAISNMLYFSFICLTSTGMSEVLPLHPFARSLTNLEAVVGQLYLTILLARLVTLHVASGPERD